MAENVENKFLSFVKGQNLFTEGEILLTGLSGGPDSVFLLHILTKFQRKLNIKLNAAHINHGLRGKDSDADEIFCRDYCQDLSVPFFSIRVDVLSYCRVNKCSIEEGGRILRYEALNKIRVNSGSEKILTGHTLDDSAETILFNLFRGSGLKGLMGIPVQREHICRPLLNITKKEIIEYLEDNKIPFRTDSSNRDTTFKRNFLREKIIPQLQEQINPAVQTNIVRFGHILGGNLKFIKSFIAEYRDKFTEYSGSELKINLELFNTDNDFITGEVLKSIWNDTFSREFSSQILYDLTDLARLQTGRRLRLAEALEAVKERNYLIIKEVKKLKNPEEIEIKGGDSVEYLGRKIKITDMEYSDLVKINSKDFQIISGDNTNNIFILRKWKNGDRFIPLGMKYFKKVSDFLTDEKVDASRKKNELVLLNENNIVWVVGRRIDERFKVLPSTKKVYKLWTN